MQELQNIVLDGSGKVILCTKVCGLVPSNVRSFLFINMWLNEQRQVVESGCQCIGRYMKMHTDELTNKNLTACWVLKNLKVEICCKVSNLTSHLSTI